MAYQLLDPREEEELFKARLLNVEEKPFKRITKRLALLNRVVASAGVQEQTPPPEAEGEREGEAANRESAPPVPSVAVVDKEKNLAEIAQLREDITLDFAAFDSSIARLQFLAAANARERTRYADHRLTIEDTCRSVRDDTLVGLRSQLETARATLKQRQAFDALADKITSSKTLWPRPEQQATIDKLEDECRQLQRESEAYAVTWSERKQQFARIMDESMRLRRQIRDEKEEVERREGMDEEEEGAAGGASGPAGIAGARGTTPAPGTAAAAANMSAAPSAGDTPASAAGGATLNVPEVTTNGASSPRSPAAVDADDNSQALHPDSAAAATNGDAATPLPSTSVAATPEPTSTQNEDGDDVDMVEVDEEERLAAAAAAAQDDGGATPLTVAETPASTEKMDTT
ncbi:hypothetical protein Sste5346_006264 [Sporothrix stenoceras]|uniref:Tho complex subunit 7 n=1 Tax=Sporothrix stenoceras TaxID=5173 RepID=A0ABR3YZH8_9PEZI